MACQKTDVIKSVCIGFAVLTKRKRKQNTVYISDKHRRVEYRLSCVCLKKVWARRRMCRILSWGVYSKL